MNAETVHSGRRPAFAYLIVADGPRAGAIHQLAPGTRIVGRSGAADVRLDDPAISGEHCRVNWEGERDIALIDLGSENGTRINGRRTSRHSLRHNDVILIGETRVIFKFVGEAG